MQTQENNNNNNASKITQIGVSSLACCFALCPGRFAVSHTSLYVIIIKMLTLYDNTARMK